MKIGFIGLGLIGGSIARAVRYFYPDTEIIAHSRTRASVEQAVADGVINRVIDQIDEDFSDCTYIFLCAPVSSNAKYLEQLKPLIGPDCIITDVGSTKTDIHEKVTDLDMEANFIGGHPMAGSEKTGIENAKALLLENAYYVLTPAAKVTGEMVERYRDLVASLKAIPLILTYEKHDYVTAAISHLPHIIASSLVNLVKDCDYEDGTMKKVAAGGFKDITRIASSSPVVWEQISLSNKKNIKELLQKAQNHLGYVIAALDMEDREYLNNYFKQAGEYRDSVPDSAVGLIQKSYEIFIDIPDEPGTIATTTTLLALNHVSIKNIGIIHNREFEEGVLKIMLYDDESAKKATKILRDKNYTVYERK